MVLGRMSTIGGFMWRRKQRGRDFEREIRAHLASEEEDQRASGLSPDEAPYAARRAFGNVTLYQEVIREMWGWPSLERIDLSAPLKEARRSGLSRSRSVLAKALIVSQVALSAVLLIGAGLFVRSLGNLRHVNTGFDKENVLLVETDKTALGYKDGDPRLTTVYRQVEQRVREIPGVAAAAFSMFTFQMGASTADAYPNGRPTPLESQRDIHNNVAGPAFFAAMGLPVTLGRAFNLNDNAKSPKVAIVNETMARVFFPGESPVGLRFGHSPQNTGEFEIVGVVKDAKYESLREKPTPMAFYPDAQHVQFLGSLVVRYSGDSRAIVPAIRRTVAEVSRNLPITEVHSLAGQVDDSLVRDKLTARLSSFFGLLALLLASIGIYGVLSYAVARRTSEVGLRMALGAPRSNVVWLVMRDVLALVVMGLAIGVPAVLAGERLIFSLLYGMPRWTECPWRRPSPFSVSWRGARLIGLRGVRHG